MANLIAKHQQGGFFPFAKAKVLADDKTRFCITHVKLKSQDGRARWFLDIKYLEDGEIAERTITLDSNEPRDEMFSDMADSGDYPQHDCWLQIRSYKNRSGMDVSTYDLKQGDGALCACNAHEVPYLLEA